MNTKSKKILLTLLALITGGIIPVSLLLLASGNAMLVQGLSKMPEIIKNVHAFSQLYTPLILIPSLFILYFIVRHSEKNFPLLANRIKAGLLAGFLATFALDTFRQLGVIHGWLPMDTIMLFGKMIAGPMAPELSWVTIGLVYHFLNGASFGLLYALLFGRSPWIWGIAWGIFIEINMMMLPPMSPLVGFFGINTGSPALFLITFIAHIGYGAVLGVLVQHWVKSKGNLIKFLH